MARKGVAGDDEQILDQASLSCITSLAAHVLRPGLVMPCATAENHTGLIWKRVEKYRTGLAATWPSVTSTGTKERGESDGGFPEPPTKSSEHLLR